MSNFDLEAKGLLHAKNSESPLLKTKLEPRMVGEIISTMDLFSNYSNEKRARGYVNELLDDDFTLYEVQRACKHVKSIDRFPSIGEFKAICRSFRVAKKEDIKEFKSDLPRLLKQFDKLFPEKTVMDYVLYWSRKAYGDEFVGELKTYGLSLNIYQLPALSDLEKSKWDANKLIISEIKESK